MISVWRVLVLIINRMVEICQGQEAGTGLCLILLWKGKICKSIIKPWLRLKDEIDENPLITNYIGRAEAIVVYKLNKHTFYVIATNSLSFSDNHGSQQFNYL